MIYFPFAEYWWIYVGFTLFISSLLLLDLGVFHKESHEISVKEASIWSVIWIGLALIFNVAFYFYTNSLFGPEIAKQFSMEFLTGFIIEKTLAIDNIFVFAVIFSYFAIPKIYQYKVLFYGILGAFFFRALFIALGSYLMAYHAVVIFFGVLLIITGLKMFSPSSETMDPDKNFILKLLKKYLPISTNSHGSNFFITENGKKFVTPLFMALLFIELSDIVFAIDSVPAIFAITKEPLIVFTSNIFAILGLRAMFFLLGGALEKFRYIKYGLGGVLVFVGCKMSFLNNYFDGKFPISWSMGIIAFLIGSSILFSYKSSSREHTL
jgi:tellurite resistance protein TerC